MKKFISAILVFASACFMAINVSALVSPIAQTIETTHPRTDISTAESSVPVGQTTVGDEVVGTVSSTSDIEMNTETVAGETNNYTISSSDAMSSVRQDTNPSSPDTGIGTTVSKTVVAAVIMVTSLAVAGYCTVKKKVD